MADNDYMMEVDFSPKKEEGKAKSPKSTSGKKPGKRGRKPAKIDTKAKLERSRQSARECRARKKLRYQYLEELVASREKSIHQLRSELEMFKKWCQDIDEGHVPEEIHEYMERDRVRKTMRGQRTRTISVTTDDDIDDDTASQA